MRRPGAGGPGGRGGPATRPAEGAPLVSPLAAVNHVCGPTAPCRATRPPAPHSLATLPLSRRPAVLETERTRLCVPVPDDAAITVELVRDEAVLRFMGGASQSVDEERARIREHIRTHHETLGFGLFLVADRESGEVLGRAGIHHGPIPDVEPLELNYLIAPGHRGKGLATEVAKALVHWGDYAHGIERLAALIAPDNAASIRVAEHAGFRYVDEVDYPEIERASRYVWTASG